LRGCLPKEEEIMIGQPHKVGGVINLENGETIKELVLKVPGDSLFIIEFIGTNAFAQLDQEIFVALQVTTNSSLGVYPLVPIGRSPFTDPEYPVRIFGSQVARLYADPKSNLILTFGRSSASGSARGFIDVSGRLVRNCLIESEKH
jgi:hypothetical protein